MNTRDKHDAPTPSVGAAHQTAPADRPAFVPTDRHTDPRPSGQRPSLIQE